jgi:prepilin-type processing-associated H-X9-DG protein
MACQFTADWCGADSVRRRARFPIAKSRAAETAGELAEGDSALLEGFAGARRAGKGRQLREAESRPGQPAPEQHEFHHEWIQRHRDLEKPEWRGAAHEYHRARRDVDAGSRHFYMDFLEPPHGNSKDLLDFRAYDDGSNYLFVDGSSRFITEKDYRDELWLTDKSWEIPQL